MHSRRLLALLVILLQTGCVLPGRFTLKSFKGDGGNRIAIKNHLSQKFNYLIIHEGDQAFALTNYIFSKDNNEVSGHLTRLPSGRMSYKLLREKKTQRHSKQMTPPFDEMHIYISSSERNPENFIKIDNNNLVDFSVYQKKRGGGGAAVAGSLVLLSVTAIVFLTFLFDPL